MRFAKFYQDRGIFQYFTTVGHPQANREAEVTNRTILLGLKARIDQAKGAWVDELYNILWAYQTTQRTLTGETPFNLSFGIEAVIPVDIRLSSHRVENYNDWNNIEQLRAILDLLEETYEMASVRMTAYRQKVVWHYNFRIRGKEFKVGDLILHEPKSLSPQSMKN